MLYHNLTTGKRDFRYISNFGRLQSFDDEADIDANYTIDDNFKSDLDFEFDEMQLNILERTTPTIMFCFEFLSSSFVQLYLRDVTSDRSKYILFYWK